MRPNYNPYLYNESGYAAYDYNGEVDEYGRPTNYRPGQPNQIDQPDWWYDPQKVYTRVFNFVSCPLCSVLCPTATSR